MNAGSIIGYLLEACPEFAGGWLIFEPLFRLSIIAQKKCIGAQIE